MVTAAVSVLVLLGSGMVAGVLFAVALSVLPALAAMPTDRYIYTHQLLGRHWDPTMPLIVLTTTALDVLLGVLASGPARVLFVAAAVLLAAVSVVSHWANVPINRRVKAVADPTVLPPAWIDPRPLWRRWHLLRTSLAIVALVINASAIILVTSI